MSGLRRSVLHQPLALLMAILLLPALSWLDNGTAGRPFQASAQGPQTYPCTASPANDIIQTYCATVGINFGDVNQLETDAVNAYLGLHSLPPGDAHVIYDYGRTDLRNAVRATMMAIMLGIITKPASSRSAHEQFLYTWLQTLIQRNEIADYTAVQNEFNAWRNDPCTFTLDADIASQYGISYDGAPFCYATPTSLLSQTPVPAASYFKAVGLKKGYGTPATKFPNFGSLVASTTVDVGEVVGIATAAASVVVAAAAVPLAISLASALALFELIQGGVAVTTVVVGAVSGAAVASLGIGALVAGPAAIILIAVAIGVAAAMQVYNQGQTMNEIADVINMLNTVTNTPPDLNTFTTDSVGLYKLQSTIIAQTLPEVPSSAVLPAHRSTIDSNFSIGTITATPSISTTLTYQDWNGNNWSAQIWGGWFVQTCTSGANCIQPDSILASIHYVDWSGVQWIASRMGATFTSSKASPASTDTVCAANAITGVSPGTDFSKCTSYVSNAIPLTDGNGNHVIVGISDLKPATFTTPATEVFSPGTKSTLSITAAGVPTPSVCLSSGTMTSDFTLNGGSSGCATGTYTIAFDGTLSTPDQTYSLAFTASNGVGSTATQTFSINVSQQLAFISSGFLSGTAGFPVNFQVVATGTPSPKITTGNEELEGLTLTDNGNGTATISGVVSHPLTTLCQSPCQFGIQASNSQGTVSQFIQISMTNAPVASIQPPLTAYFTSGTPNQVLLNPSGAVTPITWTAAGPSWLTLHDNGDGTALLQGEPPVGTTGSFSFFVYPTALGTLGVGELYTIVVHDPPVFTSPTIILLTAGSPGSAPVSTTQGNVTETGTLPPGVTFTGGNSPGISGSPDPGSGGQYNVNITDTGNGGTTSQNLTLNVNEGAQITSPNSATLIVGMKSSFAVTTLGYPIVSTKPVPANALAPTSPSQGEGMFFSASGIPADLSFSNLNPEGFATGTLTIQGTPSLSDAGVHQVQITAQNGVGSPAHQTLTLNIVKLTGPAPSSASSCNGNYNGTFHGSITVSAGQNCAFVGGGIDGNVTVNGGNLALANATVTGNMSIQGSTAFSFGPGTTISGNLAIQNIGSGSTTSQICDTKVEGNVQISGDATPLQIGSTDNSCPGNSFGKNVDLSSNNGAIGFFNNSVGKNLSCTGNRAITGGGDSAEKMSGQCSPF